MPLSVKIIAIICAVSFLAVFLFLIRRQSLKPFYAILWGLVSLLMFGVIVFERIFKAAADLLQIPDASFLILVSVIFFLLIYVLYLSIKISEMSDRIQELISHTAILYKKVEKI